MTNDQALLRAFLQGKIDGRHFHHPQHVCVGFELLRHHGFCDALAAYSGALKGIAARAGNPGAYHETITVAFLSLIAERCAGGRHPDFESFERDHPELMDKSILARWYPSERLASAIARQTFVLP
jgi:hypothetical protein